MKALMLASVASMIDQFNMENIALLQELGYDIDVVCNFEFGNTSSKERVDAFRKELEVMGVHPISVEIPRKISAVGDIVRSYKKVKKLVEEQQYDLVHCHSPIGGVIARMACKRQRKKGLRMIYTAHGFHFFKGAPKANWMIFYPIEKHFARYTDALVTICQEDYQRALKKMPAKKIFYSPGIGVDVDKIKELPESNALREEVGIKEGETLLYSIGELNDNKNHRVVIEALAKLDRQDVHYVVCGRGDQLEVLETLAEELGVKQQVHLLGFRTDAKQWLKVADIFVFPSKREGLPVSLMEAMSAGLPVVASRVRGNRDLIVDSKGGFLVDALDPEQYANAIKNMLEDAEQRKQMGAFNQERMKEFDVKQVQKVMKQVYTER